MQNGFFDYDDCLKQLNYITELMEHIQKFMNDPDMPAPAISDAEALQVATDIYTANIKAGWIPREIK